MKEINALLHAGLCKIQLLELVRRLCDASHEHPPNGIHRSPQQLAVVPKITTRFLCPPKQLRLRLCLKETR